MSSALSEALEHNPVNVFRITLKVFRIRDICAAPDYNDPRFSSYEHAMKAIDQRIHKVAAIKERALKSTGIECIQHLEASKEEIKHFYEINK